MPQVSPLILGSSYFANKDTRLKKTNSNANNQTDPRMII